MLLGRETVNKSGDVVSQRVFRDSKPQVKLPTQQAASKPTTSNHRVPSTSGKPDIKTPADNRYITQGGSKIDILPANVSKPRFSVPVAKSTVAKPAAGRPVAQAKSETLPKAAQRLVQKEADGARNAHNAIRQQVKQADVNYAKANKTNWMSGRSLDNFKHNASGATLKAEQGAEDAIVALQALKRGALKEADLKDVMTGARGSIQKLANMARTARQNGQDSLARQLDNKAETLAKAINKELPANLRRSAESAGQLAQRSAKYANAEGKKLMMEGKAEEGKLWLDLAAKANRQGIKVGDLAKAEARDLVQKADAASQAKAKTLYNIAYKATSMVAGYLATDYAINLGLGAAIGEEGALQYAADESIIGKGVTAALT